MNSFLNLAGIQFDIEWEDKQKNFSKLRNLFNQIKFQDGLVVLPETFSTGFTMKSEEFQEDQNGKSESFLIEMAKKTGNLVGGSWIEKNNSGKPFNTFSIARPSGFISNRYRKIHSFSLSGEDKEFTAGNENQIFEWNGFKISMLICYDLRFPEIFRRTSGQTDLYLVIANWPDIRISHWLTLLKARAIENQAYVLGVNRIGNAGKKNPLYHSGFSVLYDMNGNEKILEKNKEDILFERLSLKKLKEYREALPFLKDKRRDLF